jgi:hypothetical protein
MKCTLNSEKDLLEVGGSTGGWVVSGSGGETGGVIKLFAGVEVVQLVIAIRAIVIIRIRLNFISVLSTVMNNQVYSSVVSIIAQSGHSVRFPLDF